MLIYIPELERSPYGLILVSSIFIGLFAATFLMRRAGIKKSSIAYTLMLTLVCIIVFAIFVNKDTNLALGKIAISGLGGVLGLVVATVISCFIHNDHPKDMCASVIISAPLMYSLSKFGCFFAGCCHGKPYVGPLAMVYHNDMSQSYMPSQLTDIVSFMLVFIVLLILFFKIENKLKLIHIAFMILIPVRFLTDFLRESHGDKLFSFGQLEVLLIGLLAITAIMIWERIQTNGQRTK